MKKSDQENWISLQCARFGRVTFGKESVKSILAANDKNLLKSIKDFCAAGKVKVQADKTKSLFTFEIPRKRSIQGLVTWVH
jgi:hypothetical protein